jgi:hypothetical protein
MMKLIVAFALTMTFTAHAKRVQIADLDASTFRAQDKTDVKFLFNQTSGEGSAEIEVVRTHIFVRNVCSNGGTVGNGGVFCRQETTTIYDTIAKEVAAIADLRLEGNTVTYYAPEGSVVCGTMKPSRVWRVRTLYLNGNCSFDKKIEEVDGKKRLHVYFVTK